MVPSVRLLYAFLALLIVFGAAYAIPLSSCTTIDSAGTYELTKDLTFSSGTCLTFVLTSDEVVIIKGNGNTISYIGGPTQYPPACVNAFVDGRLSIQDITLKNCEVHAEPHLSVSDPKGSLQVWGAKLQDSIITTKNLYSTDITRNEINITPSIATYYGSSDPYKFFIKIDILNKTPSLSSYDQHGLVLILSNTITTSIESSPSFYIIGITNCQSDECYAPSASEQGYEVSLRKNQIKVSPRAGQIIMALNGIKSTMNLNNIYGSSNGSVAKVVTSSDAIFSYENINVHSPSGLSEGISVSGGAFGARNQPTNILIENSLVRADKNPFVVSTPYGHPVVNKITVKNNIFEGNAPSGGSASNGAVIAINSLSPCSEVAVKNNKFSGFYEALKVEYNTILTSACNSNFLEVSGNYFSSCVPGAPSLHATGIMVSQSDPKMYIYNNAFICDPMDDLHALSEAGVRKSPIKWNVEPFASRNIIGGPKIGGNYYSNYSWPDSNGDGFGDYPKLVSDPAEPSSFHNKDLYPLVGNVGNIPTLRISLLTPQNGSTVESGNVSFTLNATSNVNESARCNLYVFILSSEKDVFMSTWSMQLTPNVPVSYQTTIQLEPGSYKWYVSCEGYLPSDQAPSHIAYSPEYYFNVVPGGTQLVTLTLIYPEDNATLTSQQVQFSWRATSTAGSSGISCNLSVAPSAGGSPVVTANSLTSATGQYSYQATVPTGSFRWTVACSNGQSSAVGSRTFTVSSPDNQPPTVTLISPQNGATVHPTVTLSYKASDNVGLNLCSLYINDQVVNTTSPANNSQVSFTTSLLAGSYTWRVECSDLAGNVGQSPTWSFNVSAPSESDPPVINLIAPLEGAILNSNTVQFSFSVADRSMPVNCILYVDFVPRSQVVANSNSTIDLSLQVASGLHSWHVSCTDSNGNLGTSSTWHFEVLASNDTTAPEIVLNYPAEGASLRNPVVFRWTATDATEPIMCTLFVDSAAKATLPSPSGSVVSSSQRLSTGSHNWNVKCTDGNGNEGSSATQSFRVASGGGGGGDDDEHEEENQTIGPLPLYIEVAKECPNTLIVQVTSGGSPVSGALVSAGQYTTTTGTDGKATLKVAQGTYTITASKSGYESYTLSNVVLDCPSVSFESDIQCSIDGVPVLYLYSSLGIRYTIYENGVLVNTFEGKQLTYSLSSGKSYKVVGEKQGYQPYQKEFVAPSCQLSIIDASLNYVCSEDGMAQVKLTTFVSGLRMVLYKGSQVIEDRLIDGSFSSTLEPGTYTFKLSKEGYLDKLIQASFSCGGEAISGRLEITVSNNTTTVGQEVIVYTTIDGKPVDIALILTYPDGSTIQVKTIDGEYAFVPGAPGTYTIKSGNVQKEVFVAEAEQLPIMWIIIPIIIIFLLAGAYYLYATYAKKEDEKRSNK
ncbi:MAG: Ig-like domain-containing protein [Candidatus Anstonellales archaeon]